MLIRIENNGVVYTHQEPIEPIDCLELRMDTFPPVVGAVAQAYSLVVAVAPARAVVVAHVRVVAVVQVAAPRELRKFHLLRKLHVPHSPGWNYQSKSREMLRWKWRRERHSQEPPSLTGLSGDFKEVVQYQGRTLFERLYNM